MKLGQVVCAVVVLAQWMPSAFAVRGNSVSHDSLISRRTQDEAKKDKKDKKDKKEKKEKADPKKKEKTRVGNLKVNTVRSENGDVIEISAKCEGDMPTTMPAEEKHMPQVVSYKYNLHVNSGIDPNAGILKTVENELQGNLTAGLIDCLYVEGEAFMWRGVSTSPADTIQGTCPATVEGSDCYVVTGGVTVDLVYLVQEARRALQDSEAAEPQTTIEDVRLPIVLGPILNEFLSDESLSELDSNIVDVEFDGFTNINKEIVTDDVKEQVFQAASDGDREGSAAACANPLLAVLAGLAF